MVVRGWRPPTAGGPARAQCLSPTSTLRTQPGLRRLVRRELEATGRVRWPQYSNLPTRARRTRSILFLTVLSGFTLSIQAGSFTALVGPSGGGKTTVLALLERFYDPTGGAVCLDGQNIRSIPLTTLRSALSMVGQEPALFTGTIRSNVAYGRPSATDAEVRAALDAAQATEFVDAKPEGWLTKVKDGERVLARAGVV